MNTQGIILTTTILFLFLACKKEDDSSPAVAHCPDKLGVKITITDSSLQYLPYSNEKTLIFRNSLGNEMVFNFVELNVSKNLQRYREGGRCNFDSTKTVNIIDLLETNSTRLIAQHDENFFIELTLRATYITSTELAYDYLDALLVYDHPEKVRSELSILVNQRNVHDHFFSGFQRPFSSLEILDKTFAKVYVSSNKNLFYTKELGVVGFKDKYGKHWVLADK